jgi:hypothetical protein
MQSPPLAMVGVYYAECEGEPMERQALAIARAATGRSAGGASAAGGALPCVVCQISEKLTTADEPFIAARVLLPSGAEQPRPIVGIDQAFVRLTLRAFATGRIVTRSEATTSASLSNLFSDMDDFFESPAADWTNRVLFETSIEVTKTIAEASSSSPTS